MTRQYPDQSTPFTYTHAKRPPRGRLRSSQIIGNLEIHMDGKRVNQAQASLFTGRQPSDWVSEKFLFQVFLQRASVNNRIHLVYDNGKYNAAVEVSGADYISMTEYRH